MGCEKIVAEAIARGQVVNSAGLVLERARLGRCNVRNGKRAGVIHDILSMRVAAAQDGSTSTGGIRCRRQANSQIADASMQTPDGSAPRARIGALTAEVWR